MASTRGTFESTSRRRRVVSAILLALCAAPIGAHAGENLLRNPGFEDVPDNTQTQGIMPLEWLLIFSSPDTYSNDGSYGLPPTTGGNFTGVTAHEGIRWIAGWTLAGETPGQLLTNPLTPGERYRISAYLHQGQRADFAFPGAYEILLNDGPDLLTPVSLGAWPQTETSDQWEFRTLTFVAPEDAATLPYLLLQPYFGDVGSAAYPGIDCIELTRVTCIADLIGDDSVGFADLTQLLNAWGPCACVEDLDSNGSVGFSDLTILLNAWGPCVSAPE